MFYTFGKIELNRWIHFTTVGMFSSVAELPPKSLEAVLLILEQSGTRQGMSHFVQIVILLGQ